LTGATPDYWNKIGCEGVLRKSSDLPRDQLHDFTDVNVATAVLHLHISFLVVFVFNFVLGRRFRVSSHDAQHGCLTIWLSMRLHVLQNTHAMSFRKQLGKGSADRHQLLLDRGRQSMPTPWPFSPGQTKCVHFVLFPVQHFSRYPSPIVGCRPPWKAHDYGAPRREVTEDFFPVCRVRASSVL